jgi:hypothetical protein
MAKISARGAKAVRKARKAVVCTDGATGVYHRVLCSDGRILERVSYRPVGGSPYSTSYFVRGKTTAEPESWLVAQLANGWERE